MEPCIYNALLWITKSIGVFCYDRKVSIFDHRRYGIDRFFKSIRYVYDKDGLSARNKEFDGNRYRARRKTNDNR